MLEDKVFITQVLKILKEIQSYKQTKILTNELKLAREIIQLRQISNEKKRKNFYKKKEEIFQWIQDKHCLDWKLG